MPLKKTNVAKKSEPEPVTSRDGGARRKPGRDATDAAAAEARSIAQAQLKAFEQAVRLFHARKFAEARELFEKAAGGPKLEMAHNAQLHIRMCTSRLEKQVLELKTAEDRYNYAVAMINVRKLDEA